MCLVLYRLHGDEVRAYDIPLVMTFSAQLIKGVRRAAGRWCMSYIVRRTMHHLPADQYRLGICHQNYSA
jgi:hypothetical protein